METTNMIIFLLCTVFVAVVLWISNRCPNAVEDSDTSKKNRNDILPNSTRENMEQKKGTRDLLLETLTAIGCQYKIGEGDDDRIRFAYQGENFVVAADNQRPYINIWDYAWGSVELDDIDEVSRLRKAINVANWQNSVTTVFTIDKENNSIDVHCKTTIILIPELPDIVDYMKVELGEFFRAHRLVGNEMARLREKEEAVEQA